MEKEKEGPRHREDVYILLDLVSGGRSVDPRPVPGPLYGGGGGREENALTPGGWSGGECPTLTPEGWSGGECPTLTFTIALRGQTTHPPAPNTSRIVNTVYFFPIVLCSLEGSCCYLLFHHLLLLLLLLFAQLVQTSPFVTMDQLEHCLPYALLRDSYSQVYRIKVCASRDTSLFL